MNYSLSLVVNGHDILYMYSSHFYLCLSIIFLCDSIFNVCLISHGAIKKCRYFPAQVLSTEYLKLYMYIMCLLRT